MLIGFIVAGEVAFWLLMAAGLVARYPLRMRRTGTALLLSTPVIDVLLLAATAIDLRNGAEPSGAHGLAAAYLGFSVAFGPSLVRWADERFAYRFAGGDRPAGPPPSPSWERVRHEWRQWLRMVAAAVIACVLLLAAIWYVDDPGRTGQFWGWMSRMGLVTAVWLAGWPVRETVKTASRRPARI